MSIFKYAHKARSGIAITKSISANPFGFALDRLVALIIQAFIPIPFAGEMAIYFKGPVLAFLCTIGVILLTIIFVIIVTITTPISIIQNIGNIVGSLTGTSAESIPIEALTGYIEEGFADTAIPERNPFGGNGFNFSVVTAGYHDPDYYRRFNMIHDGVDLVPTEAYFKNDSAYTKTGVVVVFATNTGKSRIYTDEYGALTVDVTNNDQTIKTVYKHLKQIIVGNGAEITAGQPVGVMGDTGFAFGEHLHYEVRQNQGGAWVTVNPLTYIH